MNGDGSSDKQYLSRSNLFHVIISLCGVHKHILLGRLDYSRVSSGRV